MQWLFEFFTWERSLWISGIALGLYIVVCVLEAIVKKKQKKRNSPVKRCTGGDPHDGCSGAGALDASSASE